MTETAHASADWLALREPEDARARSTDLARAAADLVRGGGVVHDLGSGTGSMMRWLAPQIDGEQTWILHDADEPLLRRALHEPRPLGRRGQRVAAHGELGLLSRLEAADLRGARLVTASALLDVLTVADLRAIVDALVGAGVPAFLSLSVTGRVEQEPPHAADPQFERAFADHQRRDVAGRRFAGPDAADLTRHLVTEAGWQVDSASTFWRLDARQPQLLSEWLDGWLGAALEQEPALATTAPGYADLRRGQAARGELSAVVHHVDLLARPR
ncbi:SAM-dependent methyltransferase [Frondihabitans australicus]|uniref:Methyltransferase family protein n=1 Tax=Frondihabitans australicus TaxID=386892 RepID=A0A495IGY2_9MICO|nr:SAM-dependent methyltransferase [Frondihabitans australicus]RKR75247.1 hypothetical protein C8E83_2385 [Frondihabitans australicus]